MAKMLPNAEMSSLKDGVRGCFVGATIGDALGKPSEGMT